ncbi:MAG: insulinase family protein [Fimbriimonadaceae bacterium]|nr:insulinase family protein [Fimbriimonadaceae bacterium]
MLAMLCAMTALIQLDQGFAWKRVNLDNGSAVIVQSLPNAKTISVNLFAASRGVQESAETHGMRHLLEHILAKGPDKDLDRKIETKGLFLTAETYRDAMQFEVRGTFLQLNEALSVLEDLLKPVKTTTQEIGKEIKIISQELAILPDSARLSSAAWNLAYGTEGFDPLGNLAIMAKATPESLLALQQKHFTAGNLVISIAGPIPETEAIAAARKILEPLKGTPDMNWSKRPDAKPGNGEAEIARGSARGAGVGRYSEADTAWTIAAAFGVATEFDDGFFIYTPSIQNGLVLVGSTSDKTFVNRIDGLSQEEALGLFAQGRLNARAWLLNRLSTPSGAAYLRGYIGCQAFGGKPEQILENLNSMTPSQFMQGFEKLKYGNGVQVIGGRI